MKKHLKKYFVPNKKNEFKPHFLRDKFTIVMLVLVVLIEIISLLFLFPEFGSQSKYLSSVISSVLVEKTNKTRLNNGENQLAINDLLVLSAQMKANDMAEKGYFAHISPDGKDPWYWLNKAGYQYKNAGENLAVNFFDSDEVHDAWMNSPTHKENILRNGFTEIGIATAEGTYKGKKAIFVAQFFGEPKTTVIATTETKTEKIVQTVEKLKTLVLNENQLSTTTSSAQVLGVESEQTQSPVVTSNTKQLTWYDRLLASPRTNLTVLLIIFAVIVTMAVILNVFVKIKIQHLKLILNGLLILIIIVAFIFINQNTINFIAEII